MERGDTRAKPQLGARMRQLRHERRLTGTALARDLGVAQGTVSKIECGRLIPDVGYLARFSHALALSPPQAAELLDLAGVVPAGATPEQFLRFVPFDFGQCNWVEHRQDTIAMAEQRASTVRVYQPQLVPGLLQTHDYAACVIAAAGVGSEREVERAVSSRVRRQRLLGDPSRRFSFIVTEAALMTRVGPAHVQHRQLSHLLDVVRRAPMVRLGILPFGVAFPVPPPPSFYLLDDRVYIELPHGELWLLEPSPHVQHYRDVFRRLRDLCLFDEAAAGKLEHLLRRFHASRQTLN